MGDTLGIVSLYSHAWEWTISTNGLMTVRASSAHGTSKKKALAKVHWDVSCQYIGFRSTTSTFLGTSQRGTDIVPRVCGFVDCVTHSPTGIFIFDAQDLVLIKPKQHNQKLQRLVLCTSRKSVLIAFAADLHTNKPWQGQHKFWSTSRRRASLAGEVSPISDIPWCSKTSITRGYQKLKAVSVQTLVGR